MEELDSSNGVLFPVYDEDTGLIFLCGKVEENWRSSREKKQLLFLSFRVIRLFDILNIHPKHLIFTISIHIHPLILNVVWA